MGDKNKFCRILKKDILNDFEQYALSLFKEDSKLLNNKNIDKVIAISKHSYDDMIDLFNIDPQRISLISNALSDRYKKRSGIDKGQIKTKFGLSEDTKLFIFVGRLDPVKGVYLLIKAFRKVLESNQTAHLFIIGSSDYETYFRLSLI